MNHDHPTAADYAWHDARLATRMVERLAAKLGVPVDELRDPPPVTDATFTAFAKAMRVHSEAAVESLLAKTEEP